jgi:hypothetical protein
MKRILSLIGVVLVMGCGPEPRDMETLERVDGVYMNPEDGQPYSGPVFGMVGDVRTMTVSLKDGEWDGPYESFYENGQLRRKLIYKDGEVDGPYEEYDRDGQLEEKGTFKDNEKCGEWFEEGETVTYDPC